MSKSKLLNALVLLAVSCSALVLRAAPVTNTILHDTFAASAANAGLAIDTNGYRAPTSTQAVWYGGGAALTYTQNTSVGLSAGNRGLLAYFTPSTGLATIAQGETLTATVTFKFTGGTAASTAGDFRMGFLNSGGNGGLTNDGASASPRPVGEPAPGARIAADNFSLTSGGNTPRGYSGYVVDTTASTVASANSQSFWRREGGQGRSQQWLGPTSSDLAANSTFTQILPGAGGGTAGAIVNDGTVYVAKLAVTSVAANQVTLTYSVTSGATTVMAYSITETSDSPRVGFDTFMILSTYNAALTVTDFLVTRTSISPAITTQPADQVVPINSTATFTAVATGAPAPTYQWQKGSTPIAGATSATLTLTNVQGADAGSYSVVATNSAGSVTSSAAALTVLTVPEITAQPASPTIFEGQGVTLAATVRGAPTLVYQWYKDGVAVTDGGGFSGATTAALTRTGAQQADTGAYTLTITNTYGSVTSAPANLTVYPSTPPSITTQPVSQSVFEGVDVTFRVVADGPPPFSYVWKKGGVPLADNGRVTGSATATLHLGSVPLTDAGSYSVTVSNFAASVDSAAATLTVNAAPTPLAPAALTARNINEVGFTARWSASANATGYGLDVATDTAFTSLVAGYANLDVGPVLSAAVAGLSIDTTYYYRVRAYNSSGTSASSNTITVRVQSPVAPVITSAPVAVFTAGVAGAFTITATGAPAPTFSATGLPAWAALDAVTGVLSGTPPANAAGTQAAVTITATNDKAPDAVQALSVSVQAVPSVAEPLTVTTLAGLALTTGTTDGTGSAARFNHLSAVATDAAGNIYVADTGGHIIRKVTAAGVVTTLAGKAGVSGSADGTGSAASFKAPSGIAVDGSGNIYVADTQNHTIRKVTAAGVVTTVAGSPGVSGSADGTAAARFFWPQGLALDAAGANLYVADTNNHTIRKIVLAGGTVSTLAGTAGAAGSADGTGAAAGFNAPEGIAIDQTGNLYVADTGNGLIRFVTPGGVVSTLAGLVGSAGAADGTGAAARFNHPAAIAVDASFIVYVLDTDNHTIRKIVSGAGVTTTIAGQAGAVGSADGTGGAARFNFPTGLFVSAAGDLYVADTDNSILRVGGLPSLPVITTQPQSQAVASGATVQFTVKATGRPAPTYQWSLNGAQLAGATAATLTIANAGAVNAGDYTVTVTNALGSVTSNRAGLVINSTTNPGPVSLPGGGGGGAPSDFFWAALGLLGAVRWLTRRPALLRRVAGSRFLSLAVLLGLVLLPVAARAQVPVITIQPTSQVAALGGSVTLTVTATGATSYRWQKNSVDLADQASHISGSGTASLALSNIVATDFDVYQVVVTNGPDSVTSNPVYIGAIAAGAATNITTGSFTFSWNSVANATGYRIDVSTNRSFGTGYFVSGYQSLDLGNVLSTTITGLVENTTYYYRIRPTGWGGNSALQAARTASSAPALTGVLFNETIPNATAASNTDLNVGLSTDTFGYLVPTSSQAPWYLGGSTSVNGYIQFVQFGLSAGASRGYLMYFTPSSSVVTLADGDVLTARVRFKMTDGTPLTPTSSPTSAGDFRVALLNSNGNGTNVNFPGSTAAFNPARIPNANETTLSVTNNRAARGYSGYVLETSVSTAAPASNAISFWRRSAATQAFTAPSPAVPAQGSGAWAGPAVATNTLAGLAQPDLTFTPIGTASTAGTATVGAMPNDGSDYVLDLSVKRISSTQVNLSFVVTNGATTVQSYSATHTGTIETAFDTFFIFNNVNVVMPILGMTVAKASPLSAPTANTASNITLTGFTANWTADANASSYRLDVATDSAFGSLVSGYSDLNVGHVTSAAVTGLNAGTPYYYRVRSVNAAGTSASSSTITTSTTLVAPVATAATATSSAGFTANWGAVAGATGYRLDVSTSNVFATFVAGYQDLDVGNNTSAAVAGLADFTTYYYQVRAVNGVATTTSSNAITVSTSAAALTINTQPQSQSVLVGDNVTFTVAATSSTGLSYQWQSKPVSGVFTDMAGQTAASLTLNNVQLADSGTQYQVIVRNLAGPVTSSAVTLTVNSSVVPPTVTTAPQSQTINQGGTATFSYAASGTAPFTQQWQKKSSGGSFADISGQTGATLTITNAQAGDAADYRVIITNSASSDTSAAATLTVILIPAAPTASAATAVGTGGFTANWSAVSGATSYRLDVSTSNTFASFVTGYNDLSVGNVTSLAVTGLSDNTTYYYRVRASNVAGTSASSALITALTPPALATITTQPAAQSSDLGTSVTFTVAATSSTTITYQWQKKPAGGSYADIAGATSATLTLNPLQASDAGDYRVNLTNSAGTVTSSTATLTVTIPLPAIVVQPQSQSALTGTRVSFNVRATGIGPFTYQWNKAGTPIAGATGQSLQLAGLAAADATAYTVDVTNGGGTTTSSPATLTLVAPAATLPAQPNIPAGVFKVTDYGAVGDGTTDNTAAITAAITAAQNAGGGTIQIPGASGAYLTGPITLRSNMNLQIDGGATLRALPYASYPNATTNPANLITIASGSTNVALTGNGVIEGDGSVWWTAYNANNAINRPRLVQFTSASNVYIGGLTLQNSPQFHIALSGSGGTPNNNITAFGLTITAPGNSPNTDGFDPTATNILIQKCSIAVGDDNIAIKAQNGNCGNMTIADCTFGVGHGLSVGGQTNFGLNGLTVKGCTFNGTTSGLRLKADATQGGLVQNVTYSDLTMTNVPYPIVFYSYYNDVGTPGATSGGNQTTPAKVKAWNATPPDSLASATIPGWQNITINNLTATGATGYSIIWGLPLANGLISGVTLNNVSITGGPGLGLYNATNVQYTGTTSFPGLITANALAITAQATAQNVNPGGTATFGITATGASGVNATASAYQWKRNGVALVDGTLPNGSAVSGSATNTLTITGARLGNAGDYTCTVSTTLDGYSTATSALVPDSLPVSVTSKAAALVVNATGSPLSITAQPAGATVTVGNTATFTVTATSDTPLNYQWRKDGVDLVAGGRFSGVNSATLAITGTVSADAGDYTVVVLNDAGTVTSDSATLVLQTPPVITTQPAASQTVYEATNVTFSVAATGTAPLSYQWQKDGVNLADGGRVAGSATASLAITGALVADSGTYTVVVTNPAGHATSDAALLTVNLVPAAPLAPVAVAATHVAAASFTANWTASASALGYRLDIATDSAFTAYVSGFQDLDVGPALTRTLGNLSPQTNYYYRVRATNAVGTSPSSNTITVTTTALLVPAVITSANNGVFSLGILSSFTIKATGSPAPVISVTGLPAWVSFDPATNVLLGTAPAGTADGQFPLTITAQSAGTAAATQAFTLNVQGAPVITTPMTITTFAGLASSGGSIDGLTGNARFLHPTGLGVDSSGNIYVADTDNHIVRRIASGVVTTFAGTAGLSGTTNGTGAAARFNSPSGIAVDPAGNVYVADTLNHAIRRISAAGSVSLFAGAAGTSGSADGTTAQARFYGPQGLAYYATSTSSSLYVADTNNHVVRRIDLIAGTVTTIAGVAGQAGSADGTGSAARFNAPSDVAIDRNGILYVADTDNNTIRAVTSDGVVRTLAGQAGSMGAADGIGSAARFDHPTAIAVDSAFNLYVLDTDNQSVRRIVSAAGTVTTVAGQPGVTGSADGIGAAARFNYPSGLAQASTGELYIADTGNSTIRQGVFPNAPVITSQPQGQTVSTGGTAQFFVVATGSPAPTYQWTLNGAPVAGGTGSTLSVANVQAANAGTYAVIVTNAQGSVTSNGATLTVLTPSGTGGVGGAGGGGGAPGLGFYLALGLLVLVRWILVRRSAQSLPTSR